MSKNISSKTFSLEVFRYLWDDPSIFRTIIPHPKSHEKDWMPEFFVQSVAHITIYRRMFFQQFINQNIRDDVYTLSECGIDFYLFLKENVVDFFPNKEMVIFDKIFMSLAFALEMCYWCSRRGTNGFTNYAPNCWELYFQTEMGQQFENEGGWKEFIQYAEFYMQSKLFSLNNQIISRWNLYGFVDLKELFNIAMDDYDLLDLLETFNEKLQKHQGSKCCIQCLPLYSAFLTMTCASRNVTLSNILIEGYILILLQMLSDEVMEMVNSNVEGSLKHNMPELFDSDIPDQKTLDTLSAEERKFHETKQSERDFKEISECKKTSTKVLIERLFPEYFECDDFDYSDYLMESMINTCIFCAEEVCLITKPTPTGHLSEKLELINSEICETIKATVEKNTSRTEVVDTESLLKSTKTLEVDNHLLIEGNSRDEKDALSMFLVLGVEPGRRKMLNALKNQDLKPATEDISKLKLDESTKSNRKKLKNKKNRKSAI